MAALPLTTLTETFVGMTTEGRKIYQVTSLHTGTAGAGETTATIPLTKIKRIIGTPAVHMIKNNSTAGVHFIKSTTIAAATPNTVVVTTDSDLEDTKIITFAFVVVGD